jgi:hypothetical protein
MSHGIASNKTLTIHTIQHLLNKTMAKRDYEDDPEEYWECRKWAEDQDATDKLDRWERQNPNHVYGQREPKEPNG